MDLYAIDSVNPAFNKTIDLLFRPFQPALWLKLALVVFIMGLGSGGGGSGGNSGGRGGGDVNFGNILEIITENIVIIAVIAGIITLVVLIFSYIRTVMYFIFLESVLHSKVEIREGFRRHMGKGFRVFLFELLVGLVFMLCLAVPILIFYFVLGFKSILLMILVLILTLFLLMIPMVIIMSFTKSFVVPYMYKGRGLIEGWKHLLSVIRKNITQIVVYVITKIILSIASAILGLIILIIALVILLIPGIVVAIFLIVIGGAVVASGICSGSMMWVCITIAILALIPIILVASYLITLAELPIPVFFRFYTLVFLRKIDKEFEIPELGKIARS